MNVSVDLDGFHSILKRRICDQRQIEKCRQDFSAVSKVTAERAIGAREIRHVAGQTGCFCLDCLLHRKQEWRIGDVNTAIAGPRDQWRQYSWGNAERQCLFSGESAVAIKPTLAPSIKEKIQTHDSKNRLWTIERDAKFVDVASGQYHTLMLSESAAVFASGDNTYGALGISDQAGSSRLPAKVEIGSIVVGGRVEMIAASGFASFALTVPPISDSLLRPHVSVAQDRLHSLVDVSTKMDVTENAAVVNYLLSWGRGDHGVLGHGDTKSSAISRVLNFFNSMRVTTVSAGLYHVLVLTELDGAYAFGDGSSGKLGLGDTNGRTSPSRITGLDGLNVAHISAGDEHSMAMTGETPCNRQVYSWGLGKNGRLGHNDERTRLKPTRVMFFRGRKVITVVAGGAHNLATSEMPHGVCVWSWGAGGFGQLGHCDTWDALIPQSIAGIRRENICYVDAGQRHSLAISDSRKLWIWGQGIYGHYDAPDSILYPTKIELPELSLISARAGRGRTFAWGDRGEIYQASIGQAKSQSFRRSAAASICCSLPEFESLTSDSFRIAYRCGPCQLDAICVGCAHHCHIHHCLELRYILQDTLSRHCDCFATSKACVFMNAE